MVNTAQVNQGESELFLALEWPKQPSGTQQMIAFTTTTTWGGGNQNKPCTVEGKPQQTAKPGKEPQSRLNDEVTETLHSSKTGEKFDSQSLTGEK